VTRISTSSDGVRPEHGPTTRRPARRRRRGATVVEFALVAPIVLLCVFSAVVFYGMLTTQNTLTAAAREGGRTASLPHVISQTAVIEAVEDRLRRGGADPVWATIEVSPADLGSLTTGDEVRISVSMPLSRSTWLPLAGVPSAAALASEITYIRE